MTTIGMVSLTALMGALSGLFSLIVLYKYLKEKVDSHLYFSLG
jgi:hypothetical protein